MVGGGAGAERDGARVVVMIDGLGEAPPWKLRDVTDAKAPWKIYREGDWHST